MFVSANGSAAVNKLTGRRLRQQPFYSYAEYVDDPAFIPYLHFIIFKSVFNGIFYHCLKANNALL